MNILHEAGFADANWKLLVQQLIEDTASQNIDANRRGELAVVVQMLEEERGGEGCYML